MARLFARFHALSILLVALFHIHTLPSFDAMDTISVNQVLCGDDKLISSNRRFALGFFHAGSQSYNTTKNWYLGIWFNEVPNLIPVWVVNRESPITNPTVAELKVNLDGRPVILDKVTRSKIWSSQAGPKAASNYTIAVLMNNGNLVLRDASSNMSSVLWQSFDYPIDALLPGAKIGRNKVSVLMNMVDFAPGHYCSELDPTGAPQFIQKLCNSSIVYSSTRAWNGKYFSSRPSMSGELQGRSFLNYSFIDNDKQVYFMYTLRYDRLIIFNLLVSSGQTKQMIWIEESQDWLAVGNEPKAECDVYAVCGPFTICIENMFPPCICMKGFSVASAKDCQSNQSNTTSLSRPVSTNKTVQHIYAPGNVSHIHDKLLNTTTHAKDKNVA
ncbi:hypothetical protein U9M48_028695 [Paspalum notatum var. saurae]|uniref:non-specific serine/threonine protein kinase n=1 Tax=Paspalum notatum var. saurae TaxID=547442 RepID=A0AAQ3TXT2_PASNO